MPNVQHLIELLEAICEDPTEVKELSALLKTISRSTAHVHIDVDYNGREFSWKMLSKNPTASEFIAGRLRKKEVDSYTT